MSMIPVRDLFESHLNVADLQRSMSFFGQTLGLELAAVPTSAPSWLQPGDHSPRSAIIGLTAEARLAGKRHAKEPTPSSSREAASRIRGLAEPFQIHRARKRLSPKLNQSPTTIPRPTLTPADAKTILRICHLWP